jgi:hypothetical protein
MTFNIRTVVGGYIIGFAPMLISIVIPPDPIGGAGTAAVSFVVPMVVAGLVAYYFVFRGVKSRSHRLLAAVSVAPLFLILNIVLFNFVAGLLLRPLPLTMLPLFGTFISLSVIAAAFVAAVALVVRIAAGKTVKLIVS